MTHTELVERAGRWLRGTKKCAVVICETSCTASMERPDALGWRNAHDTVLVECKTSRADFLKDRKKVFRSTWAAGVGQSRFFMTPPGLVAPKELPKGWGLLYCHPKKVEVVVNSAPRVREKAVAWNEVVFLYSMVRKAMLCGLDVQAKYADLEDKLVNKRRGVDV